MLKGSFRLSMKQTARPILWARELGALAHEVVSASEEVPG